MRTPPSLLLAESESRHADAEWSRHALEVIQNDQRRSADTHLLRLDLPALEAAGNLPEPVDVTVDDPVYHAQKSYTGYPLTAVLVILPQ